MAVIFRLVPIGPKQLFNVPAGDAAKERALNELSAEAKALFEKTTATWKHKPRFTLRINLNNRSIATSDEIYTYVDKGTRAHMIRAKRARALSFRVGGSPKTKPSIIASYLGSEGKSWVSAVEVQHPGSRPRNFSKIIQARMQKRFVARFKKVVKTYLAGEAVGL